MPHAALWVVQRWDHQKPPTLFRRFNAARGFVGGATADRTLLAQISRQFQCRTRLCGWCSTEKQTLSKRAHESFNAARGFVGGAASRVLMGILSSRQFQCRTRLCGWCSNISPFGNVWLKLFQCRTRLCGWCSQRIIVSKAIDGAFQCRTRLCGWCSLRLPCCRLSRLPVSMPHAALWVVQQDLRVPARAVRDVSMPHAALWVVQLV